MACSMSPTVCDFSKPSSVAWLTDSRPRATKSHFEARMSSISSGSRTTSVRTCAPHGTCDALVDHQLQQPLEALVVGGDVVVVEEDPLGVLLLDLLHDVLGAAKAVLLAEHRRHGAEGAVEGAAPAGHDRRVGDALPPVDEREVGERQEVEVGAALVQRRVHGLAVRAAVRDAGDGGELAAAAERLRELGHDDLAGLAAGHVVGVLQGLVGHEGDVRAADDDGDAAPAQVVADAVRLGDGGGGAGDADEVGRVHVGPVDRRQLRVEDTHVVPRLHERRADHRQPEAHEVRLGPEMTTGGDGFDQADLHTGRVLTRRVDQESYEVWTISRKEQPPEYTGLKRSCCPRRPRHGNNPHQYHRDLDEASGGLRPA